MDNIPLDKKLKIALYKEVKSCCKETANRCISMDIDNDAAVLISELVWKKTKRIAEDLELFAMHAKRSRINIDDIKLVVRQNEKLKEDISKMAVESVDNKGDDELKESRENESDNILQELKERKAMMKKQQQQLMID